MTYKEISINKITITVDTKVIYFSNIYIKCLFYLKFYKPKKTCGDCGIEICSHHLLWPNSDVFFQFSINLLTFFTQKFLRLIEQTNITAIWTSEGWRKVTHLTN